MEDRTPEKSEPSQNYENHNKEVSITINNKSHNILKQTQKLLSIVDVNFESKKKEILDSPRSLEACRQLGILPDELYFQDFETFLRMNPEVIGLPKDIQKIRFDNIDKYRKDTIKMVKAQRDLIIKKEKEKYQNECTNANYETSNNININENNIVENKQMYNLDDQLNNIITKEKKNLEKLKRRQKNEIEAEIETKIKSEMIIQKAELKEKRLQEMNEKIKEKMEEKAKKEEEERIKKEKRREEDLKKKISKQEMENKRKHDIEEKRLKEIQEQQEKMKAQEIKKRKEEKLKVEKRREAALSHLKEIEIENIEKQKKMELKEKERKDFQENQKKKKKLEQEKKKEEYAKRLQQSKLTIEENLEKIRQNIELKQLMTLRRFNNIMEERVINLKKQQEKNRKKYEEIHNQLKKMKKLQEKKNEETLKRQRRIELKALKNEQLRNDKIIEKSKSQNTLYLQTRNRRNFCMKKLEEKFDKLNKDMEEKQIKLDKERIKKLYDVSLKQEEEFIKQYQKKQMIIRLDRINQYKTEKRMEEIFEKEQKLEDFKKKKRELIENKARLTSGMEKEKQLLITKFENTFKKKNKVDVRIVKELFPEDEELYKRIKKMTDKMNKTGINFNRINFSGIDKSKTRDKIEQ